MGINSKHIKLFAAASVLVACSFAQTRPRRIATLRLQVTDSHGYPVEGWEVTKLMDVNGRDWKGSVSAAGVARIPPGEYSLGIDQDSLWPFEGTVSVRMPATDFIAGLVFPGAEDDAGRADVSGRFEVPPGENSWCKLSGLYTSHGHFSSVGADGKFRFSLFPATHTHSPAGETPPCWPRGSSIHPLVQTRK